MGGWFHFAVFESIAIAEEVRKAGTPPSSRWPRTETKPEPYRKAYLDLNPHQCRDELAQTYNLIMERFEREKDKQGLVEFFAQTSVRYAKLGVDLGHSLEFSPDRYRELALEMIEDDEMGAVGYVLEEYLDRLFRFLHGPASYAHTPIKGPAPNSFLRCVFALENVWASEVSGNQIGESNPREPKPSYRSANRCSSAQIGGSLQQAVRACERFRKARRAVCGRCVEIPTLGRANSKSRD